MRTTPITLDDLQRVAPQVLARLRNMAEFPHHGTVAGQAVASLFWEALDLPMRGPVNDIDVFVNRNMPRAMRATPETAKGIGGRRNNTSTRVEFSSEQEAYGQAARIALRCNTMILRTYRADLVNYTLISSPLTPVGALGHHQEVSRSLVEGFDLNLVAVGINLENEQVVASPGFLDFLATGKVQAQTCNTPAHTLIRLANKIYGGQLTGVTCDYAQERELLESAIACQADMNRSIYGVLPFFGDRYLEQYQRQAHHLPALQVEDDKNTSDGAKLYSLVPAEGAKARAGALGLLALGSMHNDVATVAIMSHYPQLWRQIQQEGPEGPTSRAVAQMDSRDSKLAITALAQALGQDLSHIQIGGMTDTERYVFFFQQQCTRDPELIQEVGQTWEDLTAIEQYVLFNSGARADDVLALGRDRAYWRSLLGRFGPQIIQTLTSSADPQLGEGELTEKAEFAEKLVGHLEAMGGAGRSLAQGILCPLMNPLAKSVDVHQYLGMIKLFRNVPDMQQSVGARLLALAFPGWPRPARATQLPVERRARNEEQYPDGQRFATALALALHAKLDVDMDWVRMLDPVEARAAMVAAGQVFVGHDDRDAPTELCQALLDRLDVRDLRRDYNAAGKALLEMGGAEVLCQWLDNQGQEGRRYCAHLARHLERMRRAEEDRGGAWGGRDYEGRWTSKTTQALASLQRQRMLWTAQDTHHAIAPERATPRM